MTAFISELRVRPGQKIDLQASETDKVYGLSEKDTRKKTKQLYKSLSELQQQLYAEKQQSLLIVFQAMDAAGKDSSIRKLTTRLNAQGCRVNSFGQPTKQELAHDFLWRAHNQVPAKGEIVLFNRSHYEDVLIVKVHGWQSQSVIEQHYQHINQFESLLADSGTKVLKFMLNISPDYQLGRFKRRLKIPEKNWKFNPGDLDERGHWDDYMQAFNTALSQCSSEQAPWYVIPAEQRWFRDYAIARIVHDTLVAMKPEYPKPNFDTNRFTADSIE